VVQSNGDSHRTLPWSGAFFNSDSSDLAHGFAQCLYSRDAQQFGGLDQDEIQS